MIEWLRRALPFLIEMMSGRQNRLHRRLPRGRLGLTAPVRRSHPRPPVCGCPRLSTTPSGCSGTRCIGRGGKGKATRRHADGRCEQFGQKLSTTGVYFGGRFRHDCTAFFERTVRAARDSLGNAQNNPNGRGRARAPNTGSGGHVHTPERERRAPLARVAGRHGTRRRLRPRDGAVRLAACRHCRPAGPTRPGRGQRGRPGRRVGHRKIRPLHDIIDVVRDPTSARDAQAREVQAVSAALTGVLGAQ